MWTQTHQQTFPNIDRETTWKVATDINNWTSWHEDVESCILHGPFQEGSDFSMTIKDAKTFTIKLTEVIPGKKFTDCTHFFGAKMYDTHEYIDTPEGLCLRNTIRVTGPLAFLWTRLVGKDIAATIPDHISALVKEVRKQHD